MIFIFFIIFSKLPTMSTYYLYNEENKAKQMEENESFFLSLLLFLFEVYLIYNVVIASVIHQSDSVIHTHTHTHTHTHILFQILFPYRLLQNIKCSFLC